MKINIKKIVLLLFTFIFLYLVLYNINFKEFFRIIKTFDCKYIIFLIASMSMSFFLRAVCFKQLISKTIQHANLAFLTLICNVCAALNIVLPARAGDLYRAYYVGNKYNADKIKLLGLVLFERIFDAIVIFLFLLFGIVFYQNTVLAVNLCLIIGSLLCISIFAVVLIYKYNKVDKFCLFIETKSQNFPFSYFIIKCSELFRKICNSFFKGFELIEHPKILIKAFLVSMGIWMFECINFLIVIYGFGYHIHWSVSLFIISFIAMACMIPSASIFIGPYQLAVIAAFSIYNVNKEAALAISLFEQIVVTILTSVIALLFLLKNNISYNEILLDINQERNKYSKELL